VSCDDPAHTQIVSNTVYTAMPCSLENTGQVVLLYLEGPAAGRSCRLSANPLFFFPCTGSQPQGEMQRAHSFYGDAVSSLVQPQEANCRVAPFIIFGSLSARVLAARLT